MAKVFLSAGHGGSDPGAVANGLREKDINLQTLLACNEVLVRHGVSTVLSRTTDEDDQVAQEVREANASGADIAVSFHANAGGGDGSESYYYPTDANGKRLAELCEKHTQAIGQNSRGVKSGKNLYFVNSTKMTAVLSECAFVDNDTDNNIIDTVEEQQKFGAAYAKAILEYFGIAYKQVTTSASTTGTTETVKVEYAKSFNKSYAKTYTVNSSDGLNMRAGANTSKALIVTVPNGEKVQCYGYYTKESDGTVWLLVAYKGYTGFMSKGYLR